MVIRRLMRFLYVLLLVVQLVCADWCVPGCKCIDAVKLRQADCSHLKWLNVDDELLGGEIFVQGLDLSNNSLSELPDDFPGGTRGRWKLVALNLAGNAISSVSPHAFRGLVNLQALDLSDNRLSTLPPEVFLDTNALRALDLSGNKLKTGSGVGWLLNAPQLTHLSLARCSLIHVSIAMFSRVKGLNTLDLSDNQLQSLDAEHVLGVLTNLRRLEVADNPLKCDPKLASWFEKHNIVQVTPICRHDSKEPKRLEAMIMEPISKMPAVFSGLDCAQITETEPERENAFNDWEQDDVTKTPLNDKHGWRNMLGMPAIWAWVAGFLSGIMLCVWLVWCWHQTKNCCGCSTSNMARNNSNAALLIGESSTSLLFEETPTIRSQNQPPGTPPPPYQRSWQ